MKSTVFNNWTLSRFIRLFLGLMVILQAINTHSLQIGLIGALFTIMPIFNIGCCGSNNCAIPLRRSKTAENG